MTMTPEAMQSRIDLRVCGTAPWPLLSLYLPDAAVVPVLHGIARSVAQAENLSPDAEVVLARNLVRDYEAQLEMLTAIAEDIMAGRAPDVDDPF